MEEPDTYQLNQSDKDIIFDIGEERLPLSGFARTTYFHITGERHFITVPTYNGTPHNRNTKILVEDNTVSIYPNPSLNNQEINVLIESKSGEGKEYAILGYDVTGKLIMEEKVGCGVNSIKFDAKYKGLIFIRILDQGKTIYINKIIRM